MQLQNSVVLAKRGDCAFTTKAKIAQSGGASGLLVINDDEGMAIYMLLMIFDSLMSIENLTN